MTYQRPIHQAIVQVLQKFNTSYFEEHAIFFGGGTRITLELNEYRESIDIDFLCKDSRAYKAVRTQVTTDSLGALIKDSDSLEFCRDIRADRDAIRAFVSTDIRPIKLEFVHFDSYPLKPSADALFPVPYIDQTSCFLTKLLANADRYGDPGKKDITDLCVMFHKWHGIPEEAWQQADLKYGKKVVMHGLRQALKKILSDKYKYKQQCIEGLMIQSKVADSIIENYAPSLLQTLQES